MTDLFLSGGTVLDPLERGERLGDVFCSGGRLSAAPAKGALKVDCTGCYVTPGLIDLHLHLYTKGSCLGVPADLAMLPNGVTTGVDAGTAGVWNFDACRAVNRGQYADVYYLVNVASTGLISDDLVEDTTPEHYDTEALRRLFLRERDRLLGLKIKMGKTSAAGRGILPLQKTLSLAGALGVPVVVHVTDPGAPMDEIADCLRPGDIFCHVFQGKGETILQQDGSVRESVRRARKRGVLFDACNGNGNFDLTIASRAIMQGFLPDIISTDLTPLSWYKGYSVSMPVLISKYLALGLDFSQILWRTVRLPAAFLCREEELGSLRPGTQGDIAVWRMEERPVVFCDAAGHTLNGNRMVRPVLTVKRGEILYRAPDF